MTDIPELKPCPFCGGRSYLANVAMAGCCYAVCTECRIQSDDGSQDRVVNNWNTRTPPQVKPLVFDCEETGDAVARVFFGAYYVQWDDEVQSWYGSLELGEDDNPIILEPSECASDADAIDVCQADYKRRILDSLE